MKRWLTCWRHFRSPWDRNSWTPWRWSRIEMASTSRAYRATWRRTRKRLWTCCLRYTLHGNMVYYLNNGSCMHVHSPFSLGGLNVIFADFLGRNKPSNCRAFAEQTIVTFSLHLHRLHRGTVAPSRVLTPSHLVPSWALISSRLLSTLEALWTN